MSDKLAATFHGGSGTPVFVTVVGAGTPTAVTEAAKEALVQLGWTPPEEHVREVLAVHEGYGVEAWCPACMEHWPCQAVEAAT